MKNLKSAILSRWYLQAAFYALIIGAIFLVWILSDSQGVAFLYSEF